MRVAATTRHQARRVSEASADGSTVSVCERAADLAPGFGSFAHAVFVADVRVPILGAGP